MSFPNGGFSFEVTNTNFDSVLDKSLMLTSSGVCLRKGRLLNSF